MRVAITIQHCCTSSHVPVTSLPHWTLVPNHLNVEVLPSSEECLVVNMGCSSSKVYVVDTDADTDTNAFGGRRVWVRPKGTSKTSRRSRRRSSIEFKVLEPRNKYTVRRRCILRTDVETILMSMGKVGRTLRGDLVSVLYLEDDILVIFHKDVVGGMRVHGVRGLTQTPTLRALVQDGPFYIRFNHARLINSLHSIMDVTTGHEGCPPELLDPVVLRMVREHAGDLLVDYRTQKPIAKTTGSPTSGVELYVHVLNASRGSFSVKSSRSL